MATLMEDNVDLRTNNLYFHISLIADKYPNKPALISYDDDGRILDEISYSLLRKRIESLAQLLLNQKLKSGDSIAIALRNSSELLLISWTAWCMGIITVPLDMKRDTLNEHLYKINLSKAKVVVIKSHELNEKEEKVIRKTIKVINLNNIGWDEKSNNLPWKDNLEHEALILFTSGTTSHPKGVKLSLKNLVINAYGIKEWLKIRSTDRFMVSLPLYHINSTTFCLATLLAKGCIAIFPNYSNSKFWQRAALTSSTLTSIVPSICFDQLAREKEFNDVKNKIKLNRIQIGSAPVVVSDVKEFIRKYKIFLYQGYGQTETALRVTGVPMDLDKNLYKKLVDENSIGKPMKWAEVEIMDEKGHLLKEGEEGEVAVKGDAVMGGYIAISEGFKNGYFLTGDIGYFKIINSDRYFFLKGRKKEIIIKGGINISPVSVENKLKQLSNSIDQAYVIGVNDRRYGEEVAVVICWRKNIDSQKAILNLKYKLIRGSDYISFYETPQYLLSFNSINLPMTSTGKAQRSVLKNEIREDDLQSINLIYKNSNYTFLFLSLNSPYFSASFALYNYCWEPLTLDANEFKKQIINGNAIIAVDNDRKVQGLIMLLRTHAEEEKLTKISYKELVATGEKTIADNKGKHIVCVAICSSNYKKEQNPNVDIKIKPEDVEKYLALGKDKIYNFHRRPKGGLNEGAKLIAVLPNARPEDKSSLGFNMLMRYPKIKRVVKIHEDSPVSSQLIETVMFLAQNLEIETIYAFSRPAGLAKYVISP